MSDARCKGFIQAGDKLAEVLSRFPDFRGYDMRDAFHALKDWHIWFVMARPDCRELAALYDRAGPLQDGGHPDKDFPAGIIEFAKDFGPVWERAKNSPTLFPTPLVQVMALIPQLTDAEWRMVMVVRRRKGGAK